MTEGRYYTVACYHGSCCGIDINLKTEGEHQDTNIGSINTPCLNCEASVRLKRVTEWAYNRLTAVEDECLGCGGDLVFLPDRAQWVHHESSSWRGGGRTILTPDYGTDPEEAQPADKHQTVDLSTGVSTPATVEADNRVTGMLSQFNPRVTSKPGEPIEVAVDLPEGATEADHLDAINEAFREAFPGLAQSLEGDL